MARKFGSATAFKASLETRIKKLAADRGMPSSTLQLKFVMERLLARLFRDAEPPWLLKGGFAMDLRFRPKARTTKDLDLSVSLVDAIPGDNATAAVREWLQEAVMSLRSERLCWPRSRHGERIRSPNRWRRLP
jgi:hypothetical protein